MKYVYEAISQFNGKNAGFAGFFTTKDIARAKTARRTLSVKIKRVKVSPELYQKIIQREEKQ